MAKLVRKNHKVFGANANVNDMGQFGSASNTTKLNTKDIDEIQALDAWENGWNDGVISGNRYPSLQERNALDYEHSYQTGYLLQEGIPEWEENTEYSDSSIIKAIEDNKVVLYRSLQNNNKNNTVTNAEYWKKVSLGGSYHPPILSCMWSDHLINDIQWLRADTFSWQSGDVYKTVYDKLVEEWYEWWEAHTVSDLENEGSVPFCRTKSGYKITSQDHEQAVLNKYNTDGIAWYYILDTANKRFKLPRTKWGFKGLRTNVGDDIAESLPNIYQDNAPVQERATQMYLYFYVGEYAQTAVEQTAGLNTDLFNNKLDLNASNLNTQGKSYVSGLGMPSNRYLDLTLGASGSTYTAPANGWFMLYIYNITRAGYVDGINRNTQYCLEIRTTVNGSATGSVIPARKGEEVVFHYDAVGTKNFKFIYAEGSQP